MFVQLSLYWHGLWIVYEIIVAKLNLLHIEYSIMQLASAVTLYVAPGTFQLLLITNSNSYSGNTINLSATKSSGDIVLYIKYITALV